MCLFLKSRIKACWVPRALCLAPETELMTCTDDPAPRDSGPHGGAHSVMILNALFRGRLLRLVRTVAPTTLTL